MNKYEEILNSLNIKAGEIPETIANLVILKHFLKQEYTFFFQEKSNEISKKYIRDLILKYPSFFDNEILKDGLNKLGSDYVIKLKNYENIKILIGGISKFDENDLKIFYNYFLEILEKENPYRGFFSSTKEINILVKNILNPTAGTVYSPTFGIGKDFIDTLNNKNLSFYGQEYSYQNFLLAKVYLELNGIEGNIKQGLFNDDKFEGKTFDYSFSIPPFGLRDKSIEGNADFYFINKVINHLKEDGKGVIVLHNGSIDKKNTKLQRKKIIENGFLESIILLPSGSFLPYAKTKTVLWIFDKSKKDKKVFFIDGTNLNTEEITNIYKNQNEGEISKFGTYEQIEKNDFNLNPLLYIYSGEKIDNLEESNEIPEDEIIELFYTPNDFSSKQNEEFRTIEKVNEDLVKDNLENIKGFNCRIHKDIETFSNNFLDSKDEKIKNWNKRTKDFMRLANIISLNSYIYNNDEKEKIEKQFELVKYFDEQLENEWKLETKKNYAKNLFIFLIIETLLLFTIVGILFYKLSSDDLIKISDLLKWIFGLTLSQITGMVWSIVKYLFPNKYEKD